LSNDTKKSIQNWITNFILTKKSINYANGIPARDSVSCRSLLPTRGAGWIFKQSGQAGFFRMKIHKTRRGTYPRNLRNKSCGLERKISIFGGAKYKNQ